MRSVFAIPLLIIVFLPVNAAFFVHSADSTRKDTLAGTILLPDLTISAIMTGEGAWKMSGALTVIDHQTLSAYSVNDLPDLLNMVPGITAQEGSSGTQRILIRGIGSRSAYGTNRIRTYYGQIPLTNADGVSALDEPDEWLTGNTEIIRGPVSALYGSGLGGAVVFSPGRDTARLFRIMSDAGSFGLFRTGAVLNLGWQNNHYFTGGMVRKQDNGFRENSASRHLTGHLNWRYNGERLKADLLLLGSTFYAMIPSSITLEQYLSDPGIAAPNWKSAGGYEENRKLLAGVTISYDLSRHWTTRLTLYGNHHTGFEHRPFNDLADSSSMAGFRFLTEAGTQHSVFQTGFEIYSEWYNAWYFESGSLTFQNPLGSNLQERTHRNFFAWWKYRQAERIVFTAGLNLNILTYQMNLDDQPAYQFTYKPIFSPRAGLNYRLGTANFLYFSTGHGLSHPSTEETLNPPGILNPALKPEQGWTVETGIRGSFRKIISYYELTAYIIRLSDQLLTKRLDEATFYGINGGSSRLSGFEASMSGSIWESGDGRSDLVLSVNGWLSKNRFIFFEDDGQNFSGNYLPGIPDYSIRTDLRANIMENSRITVSAMGWGSQWLDDQNTGRTDPWLRTDIKIGKVMDFKGPINLHLEAGVENLFNLRYVSMILPNAPSFGGLPPRYYYPGKPRFVFLRLEAEFETYRPENQSTFHSR
ncbi:MAG: TonB-dependent receptor [Bacteroidota bacterium]